MPCGWMTGNGYTGRTTPFEKTRVEEYELYDLKKDPGEQSNILIKISSR